jgi:NitT/TauT family transport system ATP-binding protein
VEKIQIKNVCQSYSLPGKGKLSKTILEEVNLEIDQGQFVCIVGPSGCGKSTLLSIIGGLTKPAEGSIFVGSEKVTGPGKDRGVVFQGYALLLWRTVLENVELGLEIGGVSKKERIQIAREYLNLVGLSAYEKYYPSQLSGGMKQRVAIARALSYDPKILLMDEPFSALDAQTRELLQEELLEIWQKTKKTIIFVTHSVDEAVYLSNKVVVMGANPGRVIKTIDVNLSYPRSQSMKEFQGLRNEIWADIKAEVKESSTFATKSREEDYEIA